jgi:hypothetical protein
MFPGRTVGGQLDDGWPGKAVRRQIVSLPESTVASSECLVKQPYYRLTDDGAGSDAKQ